LKPESTYDFVKAYEHFSDPEWDGEPVEPVPPRPKGESENPTPVGGDESDGQPEGGEEEPAPRQKIKIKLADGKERTIQHMMATTFWSVDGKPMSAAEFITRLFGDLPELFKDEDELRALWGQPDTRKALLESLSEKGYGDDQLSEINRMIDAEKSDLYDVLAYIAFALAPITREERVNRVPCLKQAMRGMRLGTLTRVSHLIGYRN
jgi:type I restriction enzyme R subunit